MEWEFRWVLCRLLNCEGRPLNPERAKMVSLINMKYCGKKIAGSHSRFLPIHETHIVEQYDNTER